MIRHQQSSTLFPYTTLFRSINSLDELLEHLQRQMAQMQSLLQSMSPEAREELRQMMDALLQDDSLRLERSEEHTSELQSRRDLVCRLLLEKKKMASTAFATL